MNLLDSTLESTPHIRGSMVDGSTLFDFNRGAQITPSQRWKNALLWRIHEFLCVNDRVWITLRGGVMARREKRHTAQLIMIM